MKNLLTFRRFLLSHRIPDRSPSRNAEVMMSAISQSQRVEEIEFELLLEGIFRQWGFDFRNYAPSSLRRRVMNFMRSEHIGSISALQDRVLHDQDWLNRFLYSLSVNV